MRDVKGDTKKTRKIGQAVNMLLSIIFIMCIFPFGVYAEDPNEKDLAACLPSRLANLKAINKPNIAIGKEGEISVTRKYRHKGDQVEVSVWQLPGGKGDLPYFKGKQKISVIVVSGKLCMLDTDVDSKTTTMVVRFDKAYVTPSRFSYLVGIVANRTDGKELVERAAKALDHDKIFGLYDSK